MRPINNEMRNYGSGNRQSPNGQKNYLGIIILIIIVIIYFSNSNDDYNNQPVEQQPQNNYVQNNNLIDTQTYNEGYDYSMPSQFASEDSLSLFNMLFGNSYSTPSNQDYVSYEDSTIRNASSDTYTLMVYMCGSNLESDGGYASSDLEEMLKATLADEINLLVYTGGAKKWFDFGISNRTNQIYQVKDHKLNLVKDNIGQKSMAEPNTLLEFMNFAKQNYKADRYALIFWDHGGGAVTGFGLDEVNSKKNDFLTIDEIKSVVDKFGPKLDFVGFDACLMANVETAYALKNGANYLVASEETEPGTGWDYIKVLNGLSKDTAQNASAVGKNIVDSFIALNSSYRNPDATLSCVDLSKMDNVYKNLVSFMKEIKTSDFDKKNYNSFAKAVKNTKAFGDGQLDTFDLIDFATKIDNKNSSNLVASVRDAVSYNKTNQYVQNSNGLSIFIPNKNLSYYSMMSTIYKNIGFGDDYTNTLNKYVNVKAGGLSPTYTVNNHSYTQSNTDYSIFDWFDLALSRQMKDYYAQNTIDTSELEVIDKENYFALKLSKEDWEKITKVESVLWFSDGKGYIDMGADSYFNMDDEGDLKVEFDGTWLAINGDNIVYEVIERTEDYEKGRVPCVINDERVNLILYFDKENPDGIVLGYQPDYDEQELVILEKGLRKLRIGDKIDFVAKYYEENGELQDEYYINDTLVIGEEPLKISYEDLGEGECRLYYRITDIFDNVYYTEAVIFED